MQESYFEPQREQMGQTAGAQGNFQSSQQRSGEMGQQSGQPIQQGGGMGGQQSQQSAGQGSHQPTGQQGSQMAGQRGSQGSGQQPGQQGGHHGGQMGQGLALQDVETPEQSEAVYQINRAIQTCAWCADQCIQEADPMMTECIRLCEDVAELGEAAIALIPRQSRFAGTILQAFEQAAQACAQECGQHQHEHCQECAQVLDNAVYATEQYTSSFGQQGGQGTQGGQQWSSPSM